MASTISLFEAIAALSGAEEIEAFLEDLCTPKEISSFNERWEVCQLLDAGSQTYRDISKLTGASTATITRVARFLNGGESCGYKTALGKIKGDVQ